MELQTNKPSIGPQPQRVKKCMDCQKLLTASQTRKRCDKCHDIAQEIANCETQQLPVIEDALQKPLDS